MNLTHVAGTQVVAADHVSRKQLRASTYAPRVGNNCKHVSRAVKNVRARIAAESRRINRV